MRALTRLLLGLLMVFSLVPAIALPVQAESNTVTFGGSGWGHGVGMSQWGAQAMALSGSGHEQILAHYYQGSQPGAVSPSTKIWVGLEEGFDELTLQVLPVGGGAAAPVSVGSTAGTATAEVDGTIHIEDFGDNGCMVTIFNPGEPATEIIDEDCSFDFSWYNWTLPGSFPSTKIGIVGCTQRDWNASPSQDRPCQYGRGRLHLRSGGGTLFLSAEMLLNDYVYGISEIPYSWEPAALRAQAIAARSYARSRSLQRQNPTEDDWNGCWCHVRDTPVDQRYVGWGHTNATRWVGESDATAGQIRTYGGKVITAFYSSSSGGQTEFGHLRGFSHTPIEWLTSVDDQWAVNGSVPNPNATWSKSVNPGTVADRAGLDILSSIEVTSRRQGSGSAAEITMIGLKDGMQKTVVKSSSWARTTFSLKSDYFDVDYDGPTLDTSGDEMLMYKSNGEYRYSSLHDDGTFGLTIRAGSGYTSNWKSITAVDLDGDSQDELMFYRNDGLYRFYEVGANGALGAPIRAGGDYTTGWDSITSVDLDGDGQDEMFFYRSDGLYRYYDIEPNGRIGAPIASGSSYSAGWSEISAVDLDGDRQDEMFFYRDDGLYRFYNVASNASLGSPMNSGSNFGSGWSVVTSLNLDGK